MKSVRFFDPGKAYMRIREEVLAKIDDVLKRGDLILRSDLEEFEANLANYVGTKYAVGVASGTDALILSLKVIGIGPGDIVLAPSYTFRATVEAISHVGAEVRLYDYNTPITLGDATCFIPAHIAGEVTEHAHKAIALANQFGIPVIEDAAQAIGVAPVKGITACYSFYPAKLLGTYGDGGAIATNDRGIYEHLKIMRNHYKGDWGPVGYNSRLDNVWAAVLNIKLKYLPEEIAKRKMIALRYDAELKGVGLPTVRPVYQDYIIEHPDRDGLKNHLAKLGVETMENGYPFPYGLHKGPATMQYEATSLRIPCHPDLTDEEVTHVIESINSYARSV